MQAFLRVLRDIGLMMARIVVGVILIAHGWQRWQIAGIPAQVDVLETAGLPYATTLAWLVIGFEIIGGILLIFGLATPLVGLAMVVLNLGIIVLVRSGSFFVHDQGWEYNAVLAVLGLVFLTHGSGRAGLDSLFLRPKDESESQLIGDGRDPDGLQTRDF